MRTFIICICICSLGFLSACSDDDTSDADSGVVLLYGTACARDSECATGVCEEKTCTRTCKEQGDCPSVAGKHMDCGQVSSGKLVCYGRTYETTKKGTQGQGCGAEKCASGHLCTGQSGDADAYCAASCKADMDCPPRYRCATTQQGNKAVSTKSHCRLRKFCHPCVLDDQCGPEARCLKDKNGAGFCSKTCMPAGATADGGPTGTCPTNARCEKVDGKYMCVHKAGTCFKSFKSEGAQCDPCIAHEWQPSGSTSDPVSTVAEANQCKKGGYCVLYDRYTGESACLMPCDSSDKCPSAEEMCFKFDTSLGGSFCMKWTTTIYSGKEYKVRGSCWK